MRKIATVCLLVSFLCTLMISAGCNNESKEASANLGGRTIKIFSQSKIDPRDNEAYKDTLGYEKQVAHWNQIEEKFNCKLQVISYESFERFQEGYTTAFAAGTVIADIVTGDATLAYPTWMVSGMLAPIDGLYDYQDKNSKSIWDPDHSKNFMYNGKCYGMYPKGSALPTFAFMFNKRIFSEYEQLKNYNLYELAGKKEWTWDKLREIARKATIDENGDGKPEIMGLATMGQPGSYLNNALIPSNGCLFVKKDQNGKVIYDLDNKNAIEAMELTYKMAWEDKSLGITGAFDSFTGGYNEFAAGRVAMIVVGLGNIPEFKDKMKNDKYGILPVPIGPQVKDYVYDCALFNFWGVVPNSQNQKDTAKAITALLTPQDYGITFRDSWEGNVYDEESLDVLEMMAQKPVYSAYYGYRTLIENILWSDYGLFAKTPPATFAAEKKNIVQDGIDKAWTPLTKENSSNS